MKPKTIQMDQRMIESIHQRMADTKNFSFQGVTREIIENGLEMENMFEMIRTFYQCLGGFPNYQPTKEFMESVRELIAKKDPDWLLEFQQESHERWISDNEGR